MSDREQLLKAAKVIDDLVGALDASESKVAEAQSEAQQAKVAAAQASKQANASKTASARDEVTLGQLAKTAAEKIRNAGLLSSTEQMDKFASTVMDHETALVQLAKLAEYAGTAPRQGQVIVDNSASDSSATDANSRWDKRAAAVISRLQLG